MTRLIPLAAACALAAATLATSPLAAQPVPAIRPRGFRGPTAPTVGPSEAARVEEEIDGAVRVSLLNLDRSALGALLEARLRDKKIVNWWPRAATSQLLASAASYPGLDLPGGTDTKDRPPLADALILVRSQAARDGSLAEVVVCEPGLGLRLGARRIKLTGDPAKDVDALAEAAISGLKKLGEKMRQLWAVPPFRSNDLVARGDNLRTSLAAAAEQAILAQKGAFTVELEFAHVIAEARAIAGIAEGIHRPMPQFIRGEYRHQSEGSTVSISVALAGPEESIPPRQLSAATPDEAATTLRTLVDEIIKTAADSPADDGGIAEKNLIAAASRDYQREGNWQAALELAETRLLIDPSERQWRSNAIVQATKIVAEQVERARRLEPPPQAGAPPGAVPSVPPGQPSSGSLPAEYRHAVRQALETYRRAMQHFERQLATMPTAEPRGTYAWLPAPGHDFVYSQLTFSPILEQVPELAALVRDCRRQRQTLLMRYNELAAANGEAGDMVLFSELAPQERNDLVLRMIVDFRLYPRAEMRNQAYIGAALNYQGGREHAEHFLAQLATLSDPTVRKAVEQHRPRLANIPMPVPAAAAATAPPADKPDPDAQVLFTPLSLPWKIVAEAEPEPRAACELFLPLGKDGDLFCYRGQILLSKKKGDYKLIWEGPTNLIFRHMTSAGYGPSLACYDGKYAWVPLVDPGKPARLLVVDPATEKVVEVTAKNGLPGDASVGSSNPLLGAAPLAPGKVLLAGSFGRAWLAVATMDADKTANVKVIHEARDLPVQGERDQHLSPTLAFDPIWLFTLSGKTAEGKPLTRVLVGRYANAANAVPFPLVVDPETSKVEVLTTPLASGGDIRPMQSGGSVYWAQAWYMGASGGQEIWRLSLPDLTPQSVGKKATAARTSYARLAMTDGQVHLLDEGWHTAGSWDETLAVLRGKIPGQPHDRQLLPRSDLHGWLLLTGQPRLYSVELREKH